MSAYAKSQVKLVLAAVTTQIKIGCDRKAVTQRKLAALNFTQFQIIQRSSSSHMCFGFALYVLCCVLGCRIGNFGELVGYCFTKCVTRTTINASQTDTTMPAFKRSRTPNLIHNLLTHTHTLTTF